MNNLTITIAKFPKIAVLGALCFIAFLIPNHLLSQTVTKTFGFTGAIETYTVPNGVRSMELEVIGGDGGDGMNNLGGSGAKATATFSVTPGTILEIVIGGAGESSSDNGGGGGGSGVRLKGATTPLIVAGGGAGGAKESGIRSMDGGGGLIATGDGSGGEDGGFNGSGGGGGLLSAGMTNTDFGSNAGQGGQGGFVAAGGMGFGGNGNGGFGVGGGGGGGIDDVGGGGGGGYTGGDASLTSAKTPNFSMGGGSFINPSASSLRNRGVSSARNSNMPIIPGVMGGGAQMNGMIRFTYTAAVIPTFNQWGLVIFGLLILNLGIIFIYQKSKT